MAKAEKLTPENLVYIIGGMVFAANVIAGKYWGYPFLYCWLSPLATTLYVAFGTFAMYFGVSYTAWYLFKGRMGEALIGICLTAASIELPQLARYIAFTGGSCG